MRSAHWQHFSRGRAGGISPARVSARMAEASCLEVKQRLCNWEVTMKRTTVFAAALLAAVATGTGAFAKETVKVGLCVSWPGYTSLQLAKEKNFAPDLDISNTIFDDPIGAHSALVAGQIDVLYCTSEY